MQVTLGVVLDLQLIGCLKTVSVVIGLYAGLFEPIVSSLLSRRSCGFLQLALSPPARSPSEPIAVTLDTQFVLKVEGVIDHGQQPGLSSLYKSHTVSLGARLKTSFAVHNNR